LTLLRLKDASTCIGGYSTAVVTGPNIGPCEY
jgi:hypothetical protein